MKTYDYLIVGAGLFGSVFAYEAGKCGKKCLVIDKRNHIGGNIYTECIEEIMVHQYGAHIFHTSDEQVWEYINQFSKFNRYTNSPLAYYQGELYNLPFNMNTFHSLWGVITPEQAMQRINDQCKEYMRIEPSNLEEQALQLAGKDIYEKLIKGYTEKQWGKKATELPPEIINRIPLRFTYDNNYFNDRYQGIPEDGYTSIIEKMLNKAEVRLNYDYFEHKDELNSLSEYIVFTGKIDEYFNYCYGELEYRSLKFDSELLNVDNYQGNAVVNYTDYAVPYTRIIEHKHFMRTNSKKTYITKEYPVSGRGHDPYYAVNDEKNTKLYKKYFELSKKRPNLIFGGRLGDYQYYDMDDTIKAALSCISLHMKRN